jgi:hypothetical protein
MSTATKNSKINYLVDEQGNRTAAQIDIGEYEKLIEYIEDLEDILAIEDLGKREPEYRSYSLVRDELVKAGN